VIRLNPRLGWVAGVGVLLGAMGCSHDESGSSNATPPAQTQNAMPLGIAPPDYPGLPAAAPGVDGLMVNTARASRGYTLLAPLTSCDTSLIDADGNVVRTWCCGCPPALGASLLENGHLLRAGEIPPGDRPFTLSGVGGRVQEFSWDGELVWDFHYHDERHVLHHDVLKLPNNNVLMIVSERFTVGEAAEAGRRANTLVGDYLLSDALVEVKPTGATTGEVVWEWRVWDHLIQEDDAGKPNYGVVAEHPERIDLNFTTSGPRAISASGPDLAKLQALGYVGSSAGAAPGSGPGALHSGDWTHFNSVAYNPQLDQIVVSGVGFAEVWVIDHSTTRAEAAGHSGGRSGKGGDLLYRWGNPRAYRYGTATDERLVCPHSAHWIGQGLPGAGHLLVFSNVTARPVNRPTDRVSSVIEIETPVDPTGHYARRAGLAFGPVKPVWTYSGETIPGFFSATFSGAQRLDNGNTLICLGLSGTVAELTPEGELVWKYLIPTGRPLPGFPPEGPPPGTVPPELLAKLPRIGIPLFRAPRYAPDYPGLVGKDLARKGTP
jgi:hypothetical protein